MKSQNNKMNKTLLIILISILCVGIVYAGSELIASAFTKTSTMDKQYRDYLLTKVQTTLDKDNKELPKEIKPVISIECKEKECKYSAVQEGIISSYDNIINRKYCSEHNKNINENGKTINECLIYSIYTLSEIENQVSELVTNRLSDYANQSIVEDTKIIIEKSKGDLTINQK